MKLARYLEINQISDSAFAETIGVSRQAVFRYKTGERFPERPVLAKIFKATRGEVTANDFAGVVPPLPRRARQAQPERAA